MILINILSSKGWLRGGGCQLLHYGWEYVSMDSAVLWLGIEDECFIHLGSLNSGSMSVVAKGFVALVAKAVVAFVLWLLWRVSESSACPYEFAHQLLDALVVGNNCPPTAGCVAIVVSFALSKNCCHIKCQCACYWVCACVCLGGFMRIFYLPCPTDSHPQL